MSRKKITLSLKGLDAFFKPIFTIVLTLVLVSLLAACAAPAATTQAPTSSAPATTITAPTTTTAEAVKPQGEVITCVQDFGNENFLPWTATVASSALNNIVYDFLIYYDNINFKFLPGLAESWEVSPDGLTLTYHLRKGVQYSDGWGELTSADVKFNFEMQASLKSVGKTSQTRRIASMETPDPYTLVVHFKDPYPTFWVDLSFGNSTICQGIASKKYVETVGEEVASQKPIGTGPYKLVEFKSGSYCKFEAFDSHWRVVPEFKYMTVRLIPEVSSIVAGLKNREIDMSQVSIEHLADLKAAGLGTEMSAVGGGILMVRWGGMVIPEDKRYDAAYHNKDPWVDVRVRKAMALAIDREAISKGIFAGYATPAGVPLYTKDMDKYQYPYDPAAAKKLLKDAGYPNGFSFNVISYVLGGAPESPRIMEALASYWQQIGLNPKIVVIDYNVYNLKNIIPCKTAGELSLWRVAPVADVIYRMELYLIPNVVNTIFEDEGSYAIYRDTPHATVEERKALADKLNEYYYESVGPLPVVRVGIAFAWNPETVSPWAHADSTAALNIEYVRHAQPLNTFRLFTPWPGR